MPAFVLPVVAVAGVAWVAGRVFRDIGDATDAIGSGALKVAFAGAVGVGSYVALRQVGAIR